MGSKKGVVMYYDILEQLEDFTDEQFGKITRAIIKYDKTGQITEFDDLSMKVAFKMLKPILDRNNQEYKAICEKRREAGSLGGKQRVANASKCYQMQANDSKSSYKDKDIDNDKDIKKEINKERKFTPPSFDEVIEYAKSKGRLDLAKNFYNYFTEGKWVDSKGNKVKNWKQKFITWMSHDKEFGILSSDTPNKTDISFRHEYTKEQMNGMFDKLDEVEI